MNVRERVWRALGFVCITPEAAQRTYVSEQQGMHDEADMPDTDNMNVVEQVVRLAIEKDFDEYLNAMLHLTMPLGFHETFEKNQEAARFQQIEEMCRATPAQRLEAALRCLGV